MSTAPGAANGAALGKRISEPRNAKRGAKAARAAEQQDAATSPPPFSPMSPTSQLTRAFSAMPIIDGSSSSSSDPPSSPGRAADAAAPPRAVSLDALAAPAAHAKSPKGRPEPRPKPRTPEAPRKAEKEKKRQEDPAPAEPTPMAITPAPPTPAPAPAPAPTPAREREKKKLNLPSPGTGVARNGVSSPSASAGAYTCPYCPAQLDEGPFLEHVLSEHVDANPRVVCPICALAPGGDPTLKSRNFQGHLQARHGASIPRRPRKSAVQPPPPSEVTELREERDEEEEQEEVEQRWVLITTNLNRLRDRSLEGLWDYVLSFDPPSRPAKCGACSARLGAAEATCMLACGHTYHSGCLAENDPDPECPLCLSMGVDTVMKD